MSANCSYCEKPSAPGKVLEVCFDCSNVMYCNRACQVSHWQNGHRENCEPTTHQMKTEPEHMMVGDPAIDTIDGEERAVFFDYRKFEAMDFSTLELAIEEYRTFSKKGRHNKKNSTDAKACWLAAELTVPLVLMYMLHNKWGLADRFIKEFYCKLGIFERLVMHGSTEWLLACADSHLRCMHGHQKLVAAMLLSVKNNAAVRTRLMQPGGPPHKSLTQALVLEILREQDLWKKQGFEHADRMIMLDRMYINVLANDVIRGGMDAMQESPKDSYHTFLMICERVQHAMSLLQPTVLPAPFSLYTQNQLEFFQEAQQRNTLMLAGMQNEGNFDDRFELLSL